MDAGAVQLELVLTGYKEVEKQLESLGRSGTITVGNPFEAWERQVKRAAAEAQKAKRMLQRGDNNVAIGIKGFGVTKRQLKLLRVEARRTSRQFKRSFAQMGKAVRGFKLELGPLGGLIKGLSVAGLVGNLIRVGQASNQAGRQLAFLASGYDELAAAQRAVERISAVTNQSQLQAEQGFARVYGVLRPVGLELKQIEIIYVGFNKAARLAGASQQEATSALLQFKQALSVGYAAGQDLNTILTQMSPLAEQIAKSYDKLNGTTGTTVGDLKKLGAQGKLTNDILFDATQTLAGMDVAAPTSVENIASAFEDLNKQIAEAIGPALIDAMATFSAALSVAADYVEKNRKAITNWLKGLWNVVKFVAPFAAAILLYVKAIQAWTLAKKLASKAQIVWLSLMGPGGWKILLGAGAAYLAASAAIGGVTSKIEDGMKSITKEAKKLREEFKKVNDETKGPGDENKGAVARLKALEKENKELKLSEDLALAQSKALYGPKTQAVIAARVKLAQAERQAAIASVQAKLKPNDEKLADASAQAANAQLIAAEEAAKTIKDAYKDARKAALEAADAFGEQRSKRAGQLFNAKEGINQFLGGQGLRQRQVQGFQMQRQEAARLAGLLKEQFKGQGNFAAARQIDNLRFRGTNQQVFDQRQKFIDAAREELYGNKALITANENLTKAMSDLNQTIQKGFDGGSTAQREDFRQLKDSIDGLTKKDWTVGVDARLESDGSINITNALS